MASLTDNEKAILKEINNRLDSERFLDTLEALIRIPSVSGEEADLARWLAERVKALGVDQVEVDENDHIIAHFGAGPRSLLISAHTDTMKPPTAMREPFTPRVEGYKADRKVYGLGAASSKSCLASILEAITVLSTLDMPLPKTTFLGVACDLHPTRHGIKEAFQLHDFEAEAVLVGEPTGLRVGTGARGYAHIEIILDGQPHHAGRPDQGKNPIVGATAFLQDALSQPLPHHPLLGSASLTPIECDSVGQRPHTPSRARLLLDRRLVPNDPPVEQVMDDFRDIVKRVSPETKVELNLKRHQFPWEVKQEDPLVGSLADSLYVMTGRQPEFYALPFSSSSGFFLNVQHMKPVAFSGGDIAKIGPEEHALLTDGVMAAGAIAGALVLFARQ